MVAARAAVTFAHAPPKRGLPLRNVAWVAAGGAVGGTARYLFIAAFPVTKGSFPWVVFAENIAGAFALGLLLTVLLRRAHAWDMRPFVCTGILGSFTTFSNLALDVVQLSGAGSHVLAAGYAFGSLTVGLTAAALGVALGRRLTRDPA